MEKTKNNLALILVAAGSSSRIGFDKNGTKIKKEYLKMKDGTVLSEAAKAFLSTFDFDTVVVTFPFSSDEENLKSERKKAQDALFADEFVKNYSSKANFLFVPGGKTRRKSPWRAGTMGISCFHIG